MNKLLNSKKVIAGIVAMMTFLAYMPALLNGFVDWDDRTYVYDNPHIRQLNPAFFKWAFFDFYEANWHPLTWLSHAVDYAIWGLNPFGHHLTSIILHAANAFMVVVLTITFLEIWKGSESKNGPSKFPDKPAISITGGVTGFLFGLHPLHVESVAWIAERKDLLCALFFLLSIMAYMKYAHAVGAETAQPGARSRFRNRQYLFSLGYFTLALLSKPMAVTLPLVLLILDWCPLGRVPSMKLLRPVVVEKLPFIVLSLTSSVLTVLAQRSSGAIKSVNFAPLVTRLIIAAKSLIVYLGKMILPVHLIPYYPYPKDASLFSPGGLVPIVLVIGITVSCLAVAKKEKLWLSLWGYYVVTLLPVLGIVQVGEQAMADRYTYLPSFAPFLLAGLFVARIATSLDGLKAKSNVLVKPAAGISVLFLVVSLTWLTYTQIGIWRSTIDLWSHVIRKDPDISLAYRDRGVAFEKTGLYDKAIEDYNTSIALDPRYYKAYVNRAIIFEKTGRLDEAIADYSTAIVLRPSHYEIYMSRGNALIKTGQFDKAIEDFNRAIAMNPYYYEAYTYQGIAFNKAGLFDRAIKAFNESIAIHPANADAYGGRGLSYALSNHYDKALEDFNQAISLNNNYAPAYLNRGKLSHLTGNTEQALSDYRKACDLGDAEGCKAVQSLQSR